MMAPYSIPSILESLRADVLGGILTIQEAAAELHAAGWMNYIDVAKAKRLLELKKEEPQ